MIQYMGRVRDIGARNNSEEKITEELGRNVSQNTIRRLGQGLGLFKIKQHMMALETVICCFLVAENC